MHPQHFDATPYSNSLYGAVTGYDASSLKFQHAGGYISPDTSDVSNCYSNYISASNLQTLQGCGMRDPPGYTDSFFHPGIVSNFGSSSPSAYYSSSKPNCPNDMRDNNLNSQNYMSPRSTQSFLLKPPDDNTSPCVSSQYNNSNEDTVNSTSLINLHSVNDTMNISSNNMLQHHNHHLHHNMHHLHHNHDNTMQQIIPYSNDTNNIQPQNSIAPSKMVHQNPELSFLNPPNTATPDDDDSMMKMESIVKMESITTETDNETINNDAKPTISYQTSSPYHHAAIPLTVHDANLKSSQENDCDGHTISPTTNCASNVPIHHHNSLSNSIHRHDVDNSNQDDNTIESNTIDGKTEESCTGNNSNTSINSTSDKKEDGDGKPTMSYIALIAKAILESDQRRLNLGSIYGWIEKHYPFYKTKGQGWRNSVRHNLSLNDCFIKAGRCEDGKGNYWAIHPANIQDFIRGDFRQRRRSRRRGRKKECDLGMYHMTNGYLPPGGTALASQMALNQATLSSIYSPYTEAERRAYRLDEALLRQSMNNPFVKWYQHGVSGPAAFCNSTSPPTCSPAGVYTNPGVPMQWSQGYPDNPSQPMYPPGINASFSRSGDDDHAEDDEKRDAKRDKNNVDPLWRYS